MAASEGTATAASPDPVSQIEAILDLEEGTPDSEDSVRDQKGRYSQRPQGPKAEASAPAEEPPAYDSAEPEGDPEGEPTEELTAEPEGDPEVEPEGEPEGDPEGISTLAGLAEALDTDPELLADHLTIEGNDGEPVPLKTALEAYRNAPEAAAQADEYSQLSATIQADHTERVGRLDQQLNQAVTLTQKLVQELQGQQPDWETLRNQDPDAYMAARKDWIRKDELVREAMGSLENASKERDQTDADELKALSTRETQTLLRKMPGWRDEAAGKKAIAEMREYLAGMNFTDAEIDGMVDHRMVLVTWDALAGSRERKSRPAALQRIADAKARLKGRKPVPPGARQDQDAVTARQKKAARARLRKTGTVEAAASVFEESL
jgi:hypothetical protein